MDNNFEVVRDRCIDKMQDAEKNGPNVPAIRSAVLRAIAARERMDKVCESVSDYNLAVNRVNMLKKIYKRNHPRHPFDTVDSEDAMGKALTKNADLLKTGGYISSTFATYAGQQAAKDIKIINQKHLELTKVGAEGYSAIMDLRRLITNQEIVYAVQGKASKTAAYHLFLEEEDFLKIVSSKSVGPNDKWGAIKHMKEGSFKSQTLYVIWEKIVNRAGKMLEVYSRDKLYRRISEYIKADNGKKLANWQAWEAYTEARAYFGKDGDPSEQIFQEFMGTFLVRTQSSEKNIEQGIPDNGVYNLVDTLGNTLTNAGRLGTLKFYQGGDTASGSKYVGVQNKSSNDYLEAGINLQTIYNGLITICSIFVPGASIDVEKVKQLFTAHGLQIVDNIVNHSFIEANAYAQEQIEKSIKAFNTEGGVTFSFI